MQDLFRRRQNIRDLQEYFKNVMGTTPVITKRNLNKPEHNFYIQKTPEGCEIKGRHVVDRVDDSTPLKKILAIIAVRNEQDIIGHVIEHYINQGVDVYIIDNLSTDETTNICSKLQKKYKGRLWHEVFPRHKDKQEGDHKYDWGSLLKHKAEVAAKSQHDWIIHCDADELRYSPNQRLSLQQYISAVDDLGYNALDFTVLDFRPTQDGFDGSQPLEKFFPCFEFGTRPGHFKQVKAWKNMRDVVGLDVGGGHDLKIKDMKVYPLKFLLKHYSFRSTQQAMSKLYKDRNPVEESIKKGWHTHLKMFRARESYVWDKKYLIEFNKDFYKKYYIERLTGVGIPRSQPRPNVPG